jgi:serine/threonine protein kinase
VLTKSGQLVGTPDYMAPEQGFGAQPVDIRADIYSLGCTLYKLLAGRAPFDRSECNTPLKKLLAHTQMAVAPIREARSEVPAGLAAVLDRMLAKEPAARQAFPAEVATALQPFAAGCDLPKLLEPLNDAEAAIVKVEDVNRWAQRPIAGGKATETFEHGR